MLPLETPRLILRRFQTSDLDAFIAYRNDPLVARWQSWSGITRDQAIAFVAAMASAAPGVSGEWFQIAIAERATGALLGDCALRILEGESHAAEIGFTLARAYQGRGYAFEAVSRLLEYVFESMLLDRVIADTDPANQPSWRLLERLGMRRVEYRVRSLWFKGEWADEYIYEIRREDRRAEHPGPGSGEVIKP